jgi:hypothetical protein
LVSSCNLAGGNDKKSCGSFFSNFCAFISSLGQYALKEISDEEINPHAQGLD